jgi:hypothetical protein
MRAWADFSGCEPLRLRRGAFSVWLAGLREESDVAQRT